MQILGPQKKNLQESKITIKRRYFCRKKSFPWIDVLSRAKGDFQSNLGGCLGNMWFPFRRATRIWVNCSVSIALKIRKNTKHGHSLYKLPFGQRFFGALLVQEQCTSVLRRHVEMKESAHFQYIYIYRYTHQNTLDQQCSKKNFVQLHSILYSS